MYAMALAIIQLRSLAHPCKHIGIARMDYAADPNQRVFFLLCSQIHRRFRPVYWSPSSRTALAEAELECVLDPACPVSTLSRLWLDPELLCLNVASIVGLSCVNQGSALA